MLLVIEMFWSDFQYSGDTISCHFHQILNALNRLVSIYIKLLSSNEIVITIISNSKYYNFFNDYIEALDDTHIITKFQKFR